MFASLAAAVAFTSALGATPLTPAMREFAAGHYGKAAELFQVESRQPHNCEALFYLGTARYRLKQIDPALIAFQSAIECDPQLVLPRLGLAEAYGAKKNLDESLKAYQDVLRIDPANRAALKGLASIYMAREQNNEAVPVLEKITAMYPGDSGAHADLGAVYAATSNHDGAKGQFEEALRLSPKNASALTGLANLSFKDGDDVAGISLLKKAMEFTPRAFEPHYLLGAAYNRKQKFTEALVELQTAQRLGGHQPEIYYQLARAYGGLGRDGQRRQAIEKFEALSRQEKDDAAARTEAQKLMQQAGAKVDSNDLNGALALMEEAHGLLPADDRTLFRLASVEYDLRRYEAAQKHAQQAVSVAPSQWLYHFLLGLIDRSMGKVRQAQESFDTALRLNPSAAPVHNASGELALQEKNPQRAVASFQKAIELDPREPAYQRNLNAAQAALAAQ